MDFVDGRLHRDPLDDVGLQRHPDRRGVQLESALQLLRQPGDTSASHNHPDGPREINSFHSRSYGLDLTYFKIYRDESSVLDGSTGPGYKARQFMMKQKSFSN